MRETHITLPELVLVAGTRAALGAGLGLLLADRLGESSRRAVGWTLLLTGALTTIPLAFQVLGGRRLAAFGKRGAQTGSVPPASSGRVDVTGVMPEGIEIDPYVMEGHPGYEESGGSELRFNIPPE